VNLWNNTEFKEIVYSIYYCLLWVKFTKRKQMKKSYYVLSLFLLTAIFAFTCCTGIQKKKQNTKMKHSRTFFACLFSILCFLNATGQPQQETFILNEPVTLKMELFVENE